MTRKRMPKLNKEELKKYIDKFITENNRVPERRDFEGNSLYPSCGQYIREWGSWGQAFIDMGYRDTKKEKKQLKHHKCIECGKEFDAYADRKYCSIKCREDYCRKNAITRKRSLSYENYRATAFRSYEWKCQICGTTEDTEYVYGKNNSVKFPSILDVHHLDNNRNNNNFRNLCILCPTCHAKVHRGIYTNLRRGDKFLALRWDKATLEDFNEKLNKQKDKAKNRRKMKSELREED